MGTHVIIDARRRRVRASLDAAGDGTTIFAVDLIGDAWDDFQYFHEQAAHYEAQGELRRRNRYVRAAVTFLFSHFDGLVSEMFDSLRNDAAFKKYLPQNQRPLHAKMDSLQAFLAGSSAMTFPPIDLDLKFLRDIVNHPSITKSPKPTDGGDTLVYNGTDVYGIAVQDLSKAALVIGDWLDAACTATGHQRFHNTERLCEEFVSALGEKYGGAREF
jgi:hypothetical protein